MKTTNYEISKNLKEEGLESDNIGWWIKRDNDPFFVVKTQISDVELMNEVGEVIKCYDLEAILDTLPEGINEEGLV